MDSDNVMFPETTFTSGVVFYFQLIILCVTIAQQYIELLTCISPQGDELGANKSAGLLISDHSLVLQKVKRVRAGVYMCAAHNREGKGVSNSVKLNVMCEYTSDTNTDPVLFRIYLTVS